MQLFTSEAAKTVWDFAEVEAERDDVLACRMFAVVGDLCHQVKNCRRMLADCTTSEVTGKTLTGFSLGLWSLYQNRGRQSPCLLVKKWQLP